MCNIAGYAGNRAAAPILLDMIRREQAFDGDLSTGIATVHEGRLYWRKVLGDVDTLIRETDALSLPGTVGIAHSRPSASGYELAHPYISNDGRIALVSNGTTRQNEFSARRDEALQTLEDNGFTFRTAGDFPTRTWPQLRNGMKVGSGEVRVLLVEYYMRQGMTPAQAAAEAANDMFTDNVFMFVCEQDPEAINAIRTVRPLNILFGSGETFLATTTLAFEDASAGECMALPVAHACRITKDGLTVTRHKVVAGKVADITPLLYARAYDAACEALAGKKDAPLILGDVGKAIAAKVEGLWQEPYTYVQSTRLTYGIIEQLSREKRLHSEIRPYRMKSAVCDRIYMWMD